MKKMTLQPSLGISLAPCAVLLALLVTNVILFRDEASTGPNQLALLFSALLAGGLGRFVLRMDYRDLEGRGIKSIVLAMEAIIILLIVGCLIGLWIMSGIVPTMIYYGIKAISPSIFLLVACLACSVVSLSIGTSWSTMGTVGVALIGIGGALGFPLPLVAGAIISGAYFGDKMSPLSDTTNLAPAVAGSNLFEHIRHMFYTTIPAYAITLIAFTGIGLFYTPGEYSPNLVRGILGLLETNFNLHWALLIIPLLVIILAAKRVPAIPALFTGALLGMAAALLFQPQIFTSAEGEAPVQDGFLSTAAGHYVKVLGTAYDGFSADLDYGVLEPLGLSGEEEAQLREWVPGLLFRGGMARMFSTITLIITAMLFGGIMESTGMLPRIARSILSAVRGPGSLIGATVGSSVVFNLFASEQYLAIVIPGRMFRQAYADHKLAPRNLSRALEDGGTVTSVLVPWNTCGAFASSVLGVQTLAYLPFCFFNLLCPLIAVVMAALHIAIVPAGAQAEAESEKPGGGPA